MDKKKFTEHPICEKCKSNKVTKLYVAVDPALSEHLKCTCSECNYAWPMDVWKADSSKEEREMEKLVEEDEGIEAVKADG